MGQRVLIATKHRIFSQGLRELLSGNKEVESVEIADENADIAAIIKERAVDTVIVDSREGAGFSVDEYPFFGSIPNLKVIVVRPDQSSMYSYGKRAVKNADYTSLLAEVKGTPLSEKPTRPVSGQEYALAATAIVSALEIVSAEREIGMWALADRLGLTRGQIRALVQVLELNGYLSRDANSGRYGLGLKLFELGSAAVDRLGLRAVALPVMERLAAISRQTVHIGVLDAERRVVVYIEQVDSPSQIRYLSVGSIAPAHCGAVGKAILAFASPEDIADYCSRGLEYVTPMTICDSDGLLEELALVRRDGYAMSREEWHEGIFGIGAPIRDHRGHVCAGISINGLIVGFTPDKIEEYRALVLEGASEISGRLGYREAAHGRHLNKTASVKR